MRVELPDPAWFVSGFSQPCKRERQIVLNTHCMAFCDRKCHLGQLKKCSVLSKESFVRKRAWPGMVDCDARRKSHRLQHQNTQEKNSTVKRGTEHATESQKLETFTPSPWRWGMHLNLTSSGHCTRKFNWSSFVVTGNEATFASPVERDEPFHHTLRRDQAVPTKGPSKVRVHIQ